MQKTSTSSSCIKKWSASAALFAVIVIMAMDAGEAWEFPQRYPFGAAGPAANLWMYDSLRNYLVGAGLWIVACSLAIRAVWTHPARKLRRRLCFAPLLAMVALTVYEWIVNFT